MLLEHCINKRPNYILRTVCPWLVDGPATLFDVRMSKAISFLIVQNVALVVPPVSLPELDFLPPLIERADSVRALPRSMGGLGIRKAAELSKPAWTASLVSSWKWIYAKIPELMGAPCASLFSDPSYLIHFTSAIELAMGSKIESAAQLVEYYDGQGKIPTQSLTQLLVDEPQHKALLNLLAPRDDYLAYHLSESNEYSGLWLSAGLSCSPALSLTNSEFTENVGLRLLIAPLDVDQQVSLRCSCDRTRFLVPGKDTFHCFSCMGKHGQSKVFHKRHNGARDLVGEYFRKACPNAQIFIEPTMPQVSNPLRADVRLDLGRATYFIDVSVVNPAARSYLKAVKPHIYPLAVASLMEKTKLAKYKASYNASNGHKEISDNVIPFVLESTGAYGDSALDLIMKLAGFKELVPSLNDSLASARRWFMLRISVLLAKSRYELLCLFRRQVIRSEFRPSDLFTLNDEDINTEENFSSSHLERAPVLEQVFEVNNVFVEKLEF